MSNEYRKDSQISRTFFQKFAIKIVRAAYLRDHLGKVSSLPSSDIMPGYTASHSACKKTTNALNGEIPVNKYQNNINHMS